MSMFDVARRFAYRLRQDGVDEADYRGFVGLAELVPGCFAGDEQVVGRHGLIGQGGKALHHPVHRVEMAVQRGVELGELLPEAHDRLHFPIRGDFNAIQRVNVQRVYHRHDQHIPTDEQGDGIGALRGVGGQALG